MVFILILGGLRFLVSFHTMEDHKSHHLARKPSKATKQSSRASKRTTSSHEHGPMAIDGRHKRVWKACERCRMKKTKVAIYHYASHLSVDLGCLITHSLTNSLLSVMESRPVNAAKMTGWFAQLEAERRRNSNNYLEGMSLLFSIADDALCAEGILTYTSSRYAEVLENTQYALIATVQKLYTMVRNNDSWELGEPELNERGQPVIHDIASRLGCIRPSPDLPYAFPEGAEDFAELQAQLQAHRPDNNSTEDAGRISHDSSAESPAMERTERASSSESDHSIVSKDYNQMIWAQRQAAAKAAMAKSNANGLAMSRPSNLTLAQRPSASSDEQAAAYQTPPALDTAASSNSMPSPIYTDFQMDSPMLRNGSPFSPWSANDDFLGPAHALDLTAHYMRAQQTQAMPTTQQQQQALNATRAMGLGAEQNMLKAIQFSDGMNFAEGTIRPNMLDCNTGMELFDQMDILYQSTDYEAQLGIA